MAQIGNMTLGGYEVTGELSEPLLSAVAFDLSEPSPIDFIYVPPRSRWEVELKSGQTTVIARTPDQLDRSILLTQGLEQAQRVLDLISFKRLGNILAQKPGDEHILLFKRGDQIVLQHVGILNYGIRASIQVVVKDKEGNIVLPPPPPPPVWTPGLRFYRLSQASHDLYEAYRNLFLGFEALLDEICPKEPKEREKQWLLRALRQVGNTVDLSHVVPSTCSDPPAYIVGTQYQLIRQRLFHAKTSVTTSPLDVPDPEQVSSAYEQLLRIWRQIAQTCLSVHGGEGGGGITYAGFRHLIDKTLSQDLTMYFTEDPSPARKDDEQVSPLGKSVFAFKEVQYLSETAPGRVSFIGSYPISETSAMPVIHRICSKACDVLQTVVYVKEGLNLEYIDCFESFQTFRLINKGLPKSTFDSESD